MLKNPPWKRLGALLLTLAATASPALASEADIKIPDLRSVSFLNGALSGMHVLMLGLVASGKPARPTCSPRASSSPSSGC
jgi:hypothetical protein